MERLIEDEKARKLLLKFIENYALPFVATIKSGRLRSIPQNRLQWLWAHEAARQREDTHAEDIQAEWKLRFGVPILVAEDEKFATAWASLESKFGYEEQLEFVHFLAVTSAMTSHQLARYLDRVYQYNAERGIELTDPEELRSGERRA